MSQTCRFRLLAMVVLTFSVGVFLNGATVVAQDDDPFADDVVAEDPFADDAAGDNMLTEDATDETDAADETATVEPFADETTDDETFVDDETLVDDAADDAAAVGAVADDGTFVDAAAVGTFVNDAAAEPSFVDDAAAAVGAFADGAAAGVMPSASATLTTYPKDGKEYFVYQTNPPRVQGATTQSQQVVIVLNTSAAMTDQYRTEQKAVVEDFLAAVGPETTVQLMTADVKATPLTDGFVAADSPEIQAAMDAFEQVTPAGATDFAGAIEGALGRFDAPAGGQSLLPMESRCVLYIGDGRSRAKLVDSDSMKTLAEDCVAARVVVNSVGVGADLDTGLLNAVAGRTGGCFLAMESTDSTQLGSVLNRVVTTMVSYPPSTLPSGTVAEAGMDVYPSVVGPVRMDRSDIRVGVADTDAMESFVTMAEAAGAGIVQISKIEDPNAAWIEKIVTMAQADDGVMLPISDEASLMALRDQFEQETVELAAAAQAAGELGDDAAVETIAAATPGLKLTGPAGETEQVATLPAPAELPAPAAPDAGVATLTPAALNDTLDMGGDDDPISDDPMDMDYYGGTLLSAQEQQTIQTQQVKTAVEAALADASKLIRVDPVSAQVPLKVLLPQIRNNTTIDPATRQRLVANIEAKLREASNQETILESKLQIQRRNLAEAMYRETIMEELQRKEKKTVELSERFRALMEEKKYRQADEEVGEALLTVNPDSVVGVQSVFAARGQGYWYDALVLRQKRQKGVIDTLYQVEKSYVPFPDEPPLVYPEAAVWRALSERRLQQAEELKFISGANETEQHIYDALSKPVELRDLVADDEGKILLSEVLDAVRAECEINIVLDTKEIDAAGEYDSNSSVTLVKNISLRSALNVMLREYGLKYVVKDEVLLVTTADAIESNPDSYLNLRVYPVADLVIPIMSGGMEMMGGMMGGMGGGMMGGMGGGMMGGMGGGMMGGMGGGMGGMGGGMGGMGMMNYPSELLKSIPSGGRRSWNSFRMVDDPSVVPEKDATLVTTPTAKPTAKATAKPAAKATAKATAKPAAKQTSKSTGTQKTSATISAPNGDWNAYFVKSNERIDAAVEKTKAAKESGASEEQVSKASDAIAKVVADRDAAIRETVRQLAEKEQHEEAVALIQAAIRNGVVQSWMYDAMSIQMTLAGQSQEEIERALMSTVEFADTPYDMMVIAMYLEDRGMHARALAVMENVAKIAPGMPEPYLAGLQIAEQTKNAHGIEWSTLGILSQVWPSQLADVWERGQLASRAHLDSLRATNPEAAERYELQLNAAMVRDCVFIVTWVGDADIDLYVKEPTDSICSVLAPQTIGGGVILGNQQVQVAQDAVEGSKSEVYVCPRGFAGDYRVVIEKVWGDVAGNQVRCEGFVHYGTDKTRYIEKTLTFDEDGRLAVDFTLDEGRRTESLAVVKARQAGEMALAQRTALQTAKQIAGLAEQKNVLHDRLNHTDSSLERDLASREEEQKAIDAAQQRAAEVQNLSRYAANSGYAPKISWFSEGAKANVNAVISADRRYVRITPIPMFLQIKKVDTFNFATGSSTSSSNNNSGNNNSSGMTGGGGGYNSSSGGGGYNSNSY